MKVVFVCTGNTCRSPMAAAYLRSKEIPGLSVSSRGLCADGSPVSENAVAAMQEVGIDLSAHRSAQLTAEDCAADHILCLSPSHTPVLLSAGISPDKISVLGNGISDPYGGSLTVYRLCRNEIFQAVDTLVNGGFFTKFSVSPIANEHIAAIAKLESECFSEPWSTQAILDSYRAGTQFFVAYNGKHVLGYVGITAVLDEGYFTNIAVFPSYRKMGVATLLIDRILQFARERDLSFVSLEVRRSNEAAIALYRKFGFLQEGERRAYYRHPTEDAIIMTRRFQSPHEDTKH